MGPSGAGKSTLLNILTGYKTSGMEGSITVNGLERNLSSFRKLSCYIMQDNQLHGNLTVEEAMAVATSLKLPSATSRADKEEVTMTSNLSGGQKKRLSIALELVNNPPIMFFDEPTSGLDSSSCFQCISLLKTLARGGRTIICTIHQPSALEWLGSLSLECPSYHNPASFIIEVSCGEYGDNTGKLVSLNSNKEWNKNDLSQVQEKFKDVPNGSNGHGNNLNNGILQYAMQDMEKQDNAEVALLGDAALSPRRYATSELTQFWVVLKRTLLFSRRDWTLMYLRLFAHILVGFLIGALYYDIGNDGSKVLSNLGFLFFNMLFLIWYSLRSYYLAITVSDIPFQNGVFLAPVMSVPFLLFSGFFVSFNAIPTIFCVIYVVIVYLLTSQPPVWFRFAMFLSSCLLISFVAQSVGLVVGAAMNVQNGVFLAPVMSVPFLLFSGFFVSFNAIPVYLRWITYLSYIRYGFEGTALATYSFDRPKLQCHQTYCHFKNPLTTLEELDMTDADFTLDIAALCLIFVILRVSAFLFLRWKLKSTR
ncbi:ATP-binding cassette transporter subfamily G, partial [Operophtera brumata]